LETVFLKGTTSAEIISLKRKDIENAITILKEKSYYTVDDLKNVTAESWSILLKNGFPQGLQDSILAALKTQGKMVSTKEQ
jgi:hypothetical protein